MNTLHTIRTELIERGLPHTLINIVDVTVAGVIDGLVTEIQEQRKEIVELKKAFYKLQTKGLDE